MCSETLDGTPANLSEEYHSHLDVEKGVVGLGKTCKGGGVNVPALVIDAEIAVVDSEVWDFLRTGDEGGQKWQWGVCRRVVEGPFKRSKRF